MHPLQGVDLFLLKFYLDRVIPYAWHQKTRDTGLPDSEDRIQTWKWLYLLKTDLHWMKNDLELT